MTHHVTRRGERRYGAYVCVTYQKQGASACPGSRVAVGDIEGFVVAQIRDIGRDPELVAEAVRAAQEGVGERRPPLDAEIKLLQQDRRKQRVLLQGCSFHDRCVSHIGWRISDYDVALAWAP